MLFLALFAVVGFTVVGFIIGYSSSNSQSRDVATPGTNDPRPACAEACDQLQRRRSEVCGATAAARASAAAVTRAAVAHTATVVTLVVLIVLAAALWLATLIPLFGLAAVPFAIAATVAVGVATVAEGAALGALLGALAAAARDAAAENAAHQAEQAAVAIILAACPRAEADACIARPRPC